MALPNLFEAKLICQLRNACKDVVGKEESDMDIVRWIRASNYDLKSAERMLRENNRWRKHYQVNRVLDKGLDTFFKLNYPMHLGVVDKRNRPVVVIPLGSWNLRTASSSGLVDRFRVYVVQCVEAVAKSIEIRNSIRTGFSMPVSQCSVVCDFKGFDTCQLFNFRVLHTVQNIMSTLRYNYPQLVGQLVCINCPVVVSTFVKVFLARGGKKMGWLGTGRWEVGARWFGRIDTEQALRSILRTVVDDKEIDKCTYLIRA